MGLAKSFIVDEQGNIESVVLDYDNFKRIESIMLDLGLAKAMEEELVLRGNKYHENS